MKSWQHENLHNYIQLELQAGPFTLHLSNFSCHRWALFPPRTPKEILKVPPLETSSSADVYISLEGITKQQVLQFTNTTIFISIKGQSGVNNFTLNSTSGDTSTGMQCNCNHNICS